MYLLERLKEKWSLSPKYSTLKNTSLFAALIKSTMHMGNNFKQYFKAQQHVIFIYLITTVELQWLKHLGNRENMFETGVVRANECYS